MKILSPIDENNDIVSKEYVDTGLATKQPTLVSGINIKTLNNESILGNGNIEIEGSGESIGTLGKMSDYTQENRLDLNILPVGVHLLYKDVSTMYLKATFKENEVVGQYSYTGTVLDNIVYLVKYKEITDDLNDRVEIGAFSINALVEGSSAQIYHAKNFIQLGTNYISTNSGSTLSVTPVNRGGTQTITGEKTFDVLPKSSVTPTDNAHLVNKKYVDDSLGEKQNTLVSGTNIKTINNESILGSGNINISGGGGGGSATDVQINGTSITSSGVANINTVGTYNSSSNPMATMNDVYDGISTVSQSSDFIAYISQIVSGLIPSGTEIMVNTFEDLPTENVTEYTKAYVKNPQLYDITTVANLNYDITQMHDASPLAEPDYSQITSSDNFSIYYEDMFDRTFVVVLLPGSASGILLFGYNTSMSSGATNMTPMYVHTNGMPGITVPIGWSVLDPETQASVPITFNEVPLIPVYLFSLTKTEGNPMLVDNFFVDAKKHWAGEYRYINGEWKYQQTIKSPYLEINSSSVPTSTTLYETINGGSNKFTEELGALAEQVKALEQEIHGGGE